MFKRYYLKHKQIYLERKRNIYIIINKESKEHEKVREQKGKGKSLINQYLIDDYKNDTKQNEGQSLFHFIKEKNFIKDTTSIKKLNSLNKTYLIKTNSKTIEERENYFIGIIFKILALVFNYIILFFSQINMNNDIMTQKIFSHKNNELLLLYIIIIFNIIIGIKKFKYNQKKRRKVKYFKHCLKRIKEKIFSFFKNGFNAIKNDSIKNSILNDNKSLKSYNNIKKKQILKEEKNNINKNINNIILIKNLIKAFLLIAIFNQKLTNNIIYLFTYQLSRITLKIKGIGLLNIFGKSFNSIYYPDEIYINGTKTDIITYIYNFTQKETV